MKRIFAFAHNAYEARGGMFDYEGSFESIDEAKAYCEQHNYDVAEIAELTDGDLVCTWEYGTWLVPYQPGKPAHKVTEWRKMESVA